MNLKTIGTRIDSEHDLYLRLTADSVSLSFVLAIHFGGQSPPLSE